MKYSLSLVVFVLFVQFTFSQSLLTEQKAKTYLEERGELVFTFTANSLKQVQELASIVSFDHDQDRNTPLTIKAYANKNTFNRFLSYNLPYSVKEDDNIIGERLMSNKIRRKRIINNTGKSTLAPLSFPLTAYPTYQDYADQMALFAANNPNICELVDIGGTTEGDKRLLFIKLSDNVSTQEQEPRLMYTSSIHGNEIAGYPMMLDLIDYLITAYNDKRHADHSRVKNLLDNSEVWINPSANPDGTYFNSADNTSVAQARRTNANGIDLNRNYPDNVAGAHANNHTAYELETQHFMNFAASKHFVLSSNLHGGTELVNYPFDNATISQYAHPDGNWFEFVSVEYATNAQNDSDALGHTTYMIDDEDSHIFPSPGVTHGAEWYQVYGGRQDYMNFYHQCKEITLELSDIKTPPANQLEDLWLYNKEALMDYLVQGTYGFRGVVKDADTGAPIDAKISIVEHDNYGSHTVTELTHGDYYRPIKAGTYDILFEADCYQSFTLTNQTIADYETVILGDVLLTSAASTIPTNLTVSGINSNSVNVSWDSFASTFDLRYREIGASNWVEVNNITTLPHNLTSLTASTDYEIQVRNRCVSNLSEYTTSVNFKTLSFTYCSSQGNYLGDNDEFISNVNIKEIDNSSGDNKYTDNTSAFTASVTLNENVNITVTPTWGGNPFSEGYSVWIDYNQNGLFTDAGEQVWIHPVTKDTSVSGDFTIPANAILGTTRMRVSMQFNQVPTNPCGDFRFGEVEDYSINITDESLSVAKEFNKDDVKVSPNPFKDNLNITVPSNLSNNNFNFVLTDINGRIIFNKTLSSNNNQITIPANVYKLDLGTYIMIVTDKKSGASITKKLIKN